ncbi:CPBP family intramembrane glutamic endopeptidase [Achromobacter xylosoxidans]|uniref:CPBP family intramembrane metalloprotease n=1 Tax=Alcaligenes xylosoxydans xylosoxydans TaxID=85698 RepID=A0A109XVI8_ALCXX|nr:CPBP family intramembrane glutamic endopeptidase [Achromobacter xylosoxidans]AMG35543.1 CPBP family intramembrane metalloprotease [Achromobacter xylosoxidans]
MPLASPGSLLFLAAALLWLPAARPWALLPLAAAYAWAWTQGGIEPVALAWPALLALAALMIQPGGAPALRAGGHALFVTLAVLLFLHWLPGFHNPLVIPRAALTPDAVPFGMYLNLDKPLVAFWVVLAAAPAMAGANPRATLTAALGACAAAVVACLGLALALGVVGWAPKWPDSGWLWLINNALLVTLAEEALFRGYVQQRLARCWRDRPWGATAALLVAALLFGLAHYAGGWQWVLLAGVAGVAYGLAYRHGGLAAAVLAHLGLNAAHYGLFTYPMRAALH